MGGGSPTRSPLFETLDTDIEQNVPKNQAPVNMDVDSKGDLSPQQKEAVDVNLVDTNFVDAIFSTDDLRTWLQARSLERCLEVLNTCGVKTGSPSLRTMYDIVSNGSLMSSLKIGKRKQLEAVMRNLISEDIFWKLVPGPSRYAVLEAFLAEDLDTTDDILSLSVEDLSSILEGCQPPSLVNEIFNIIQELRTEGVQEPELPASLSKEPLHFAAGQKESSEFLEVANGLSKMQIDSENKIKNKNEIDNVKQSPQKLVNGDVTLNAQPKLQWRKFKLMDLCEDKQNGSLVDKIVLKRDAIGDLCNNFQSNSSSTNASKIAFEKLDEISHKCYGVFGQKQSIQKFLLGVGACEPGLVEASQLASPCTDGPGLYAFVATPESILAHHDADKSAMKVDMFNSTYLVLWPQEDAFLNIQPQSKTTTFFRFLSKLCHQVFICLDEHCARNFPTIRKNNRFTRLHEYVAEQEVVQEESFSLCEGFTLRFPHGPSPEENHLRMLIGGHGGGAILTCNPLPQKTFFQKYYKSLKFDAEGFINIEDLWNLCNIRLDKMEPSQQTRFFEHFSKESLDLVAQMKAKMAKLEDERVKAYEAECADIERTTPDRANLEEMLKFYASQLIFNLFPTLSAEISPDRPEAEMNQKIDQFVALTGLSMDKLKEMLGFEKYWGLCRRLCLCQAYFLSEHAVEISFETIFEFLTKPIEQLERLSFKTILYVVKVNSRSKWEKLLNQSRQLFENGPEAELLKGKDERNLEILHAMMLPLEKYLHQKTSDILETKELGPVHRKEAAYRKIRKEYEMLKKPLEIEALSSIRTEIFGMEYEDADTDGLLHLSSCQIRTNSMSLEGEMQQAEELRMRYSVENLVIPQPEELGLQKNPFLELHPRVRKQGHFQLPACAAIIGSWIVNKDKVLVVARQGSDDVKIDIALHSLREERSWHIKSIRKPVHLAAFDEIHRLLAIYVWGGWSSSITEVDLSAPNISSLVVYRFGEDYQYLSQAGPPYELHRLEGEAKLRSMAFLHGCQKLALLDVSNRIRFYDVLGQDGLRSTIQLESNLLPLRLLSLERGLCLMVVCQVEGEEDIQVRPFISPSYTPLLPVKISSPNSTNPDFAGMWEVFTLGAQVTQAHLCLLDFGSLTLTSHVIVATGREQSLIITKATAELEQSSGSSSVQELTPLEYVFFVFDKFPVQGEAKVRSLPANPNVSVLFDCSPQLFTSNQLEERTRNYMSSIWNSLMDIKKPLEKLQLLERLSVMCFVSSFSSDSNGSVLLNTLNSLNEPIGKWLRQLICLVPIQIARAEDNDFHVLTDGMSLPEEHARNVQDCAQHIHLGLYDAILRWWPGKVVAISSMGKQSTGKSYTLNHLFGLSFEISGARCTDGCWMTMCEADSADGENGVLYVVLDFEGLGSFERTDQEDMLLSVFNAAISGLTIFKTEYRLDRDIEQMFSRFQAGVGLIKGDMRLFKGLFCIANKDVALRDINSIAAEFESKLRQIMAADSERNFISMMYNNRFSVLPFPPLGDRAYYSELHTIETLLMRRPVQFLNGNSFSDCMKTIMAKMQLKDWRSLERQEIETRLRYLEAHLEIALRTGRVDTEDCAEEELNCLDTGNMIPDLPLHHYLPDYSQLPVMDDLTKAFLDVSVIIPTGDAGGGDVFMNKLFATYESMVCIRTGKNHVLWHKQFSDFVVAVCERRATRVTKWVNKNLDRFTGVDALKEDGFGAGSHKDDEAAKFIYQANISADRLRDEWQVCKSTCSHCYLFCLLPKSHATETHSCMGSHECKELCWFCQEDGEQCVCSDKMGHPGEHDCRKKDHTCVQPCHLQGCLNCNGVCSKKAGHEKSMAAGSQTTEHLCSAPLHLCGQTCSALSCRNKCVIVHGQAHTVHKCVEGTCTHKCSVTGCEQICAAHDHFHCSPESELFLDESGGALPDDIEKFNGLHFCGRDHLCSKPCESVGICKVTTQLVQEGAENFIGKRGTFSYSTVSEANGEREGCSVPIPPFKLKHEGSHRHSLDPRVVHYCDQRCPTCLYFCDQPFGHSGSHSAAHGMMRNCYFVSDTEEIDVGQRKYVVGESGKAEMCDMFCRTMGRGHIHVLPCDVQPGSVCTHSAKDGRQHETCRYIGKSAGRVPNEKPKDELTHSCYWPTINWTDPCAVSEREEFAKCGCSCNHASHLTDGEPPSFCSLPLWHDPVSRTANMSGFASSDGHLYNCKHFSSALQSTFHLVFVLDESGSMSGKPWIDLQHAVEGFVTTRLRNHTNDIISIIQYDSSSRIICEAVPITNGRHRGLPFSGGGTNFSVALETAYGVIDRTNIRHPQHQPMLLFLSDGQSGMADGTAQMERLNRDFNGKLSLFTVGFGAGVCSSILENLARLGGGKYYQSIDGIALKNTFIEVASKLGQKVALVAEKGEDETKHILRIMSRCGIRLQSHRVEQQQRGKAEEEYHKALETIGPQVAEMKNSSKTVEDFLAKIGIQVTGGRVDAAKKAAFQKFHPDKNQNAPVEQRVFCEEVVKVLNGDWSS